MRIRMLVQMPEGAARNGEPWPAKGETAELPTAEAAHLIASGVAEEADDVQAPAEPRVRRRKTTEGEGEPT
ncbi:hypothetical protein [Streptomyces acidiscabies]|uniref:Uncharacterized protein n=1 Tax=Streptomyces acidiscabies TaxID=42234 RepID=A0ABU4LN69_9ACTN|nr:hypothetical protein [Streptomyces acidiscabies]MDX3016734.1 hypothetical protein [Streptomyces acidiscabies]